MDNNTNMSNDNSEGELNSERQSPDSEPFGNILDSDRNASESLPNDSEDFGNRSEPVQNPSEVRSIISEPLSEKLEFSGNNALSEKTANHTLSVREAARLFEDAGVPRTERSIINWCNPNKKGIKRLDCYFDQTDRKYFVTPQSISLTITEERKKSQFIDFKYQKISERNYDTPETFSEEFGKTSERRNNDSEEVRNHSDAFGSRSEAFPNESETVQKATEPVQKEGRGEEHSFTASKTRKMEELEAENLDLKITNKGKDYFIERLKEQTEKERQAYIEERKSLIDHLTTATKQIGQLETKLLQPERVQGATITTETPEVEQSNHTGNKELYDN